MKRKRLPAATVKASPCPCLGGGLTRSVFDMTEAERLALITHDQVRLVLQEAQLVELATLEAEQRATIQTHRAKLFDEHDASAFAKHREAQRKTEVSIWIG